MTTWLVWAGWTAIADAAPPVDSGLESVSTIIRRADGRFDVVCRDDRREIATADDIRADRVCRGAGGGGSERLGVLYARSDSCAADSAVATVRAETNCAALTGEVWSLSVDGQCRDIEDTSARAACTQLQSSIGAALYGRSDSCDAEAFVTKVDTYTKCQLLSASAESWSMSIDGECRDTEDISVRAACFALQSADAIILYGRSDDCEPQHALRRITDATGCEGLSRTEPAWSYMVDGRCVDIEDTNVRAACIHAQSHR
jgi:hypothetical protein